MSGYGIEHCAWMEQRPDGTWSGGCKICGHEWHLETDEARADSWCAGHNSAVQGMAAKPAPLWFPPVGPGDAITLVRLQELLRKVALVYGEHSEIVMPAAYPPLLFLWTPPTEDGWHRTRLGVIYLEKWGDFIPEPEAVPYG